LSFEEPSWEKTVPIYKPHSGRYRAGGGVRGMAALPHGFYSAKRLKTSGKLATQSQPQQPPISCPSCKSKRIWKDGFRKLGDGRKVQRWICRTCGYRFSKKNEFSMKNVINENLHTTRRRVCASSVGAINLVQPEVLEKRVAGATKKTSQADLKGKIIEYIWMMRKQGYSKATIKCYSDILKTLLRRGADLYDPESVKRTIALQESWGNSRKSNAVKAYDLFLKMLGMTWEKPRYKPIRRIPFIPSEREIDELIAGCSKQMAAFLQVLKETAARRGEAFSLKWSDVDFVNKTIRITPLKGSEARIFKISEKLVRMLKSLPKNPEKIWIYKNTFYLDKQFRRQRKKVAHKVGNPRLLRIHFHTLRHWKATIEYAKTKDILYVQKLLGHKRLENTLLYTQLVNLPQNEEYICKAARNIKEAQKLIEAGFEFVTKINGVSLFRKLKSTYLGSVTTEMGLSASMVDTPSSDISRKSPSFSVLVFHGYLFTIPKNKEVMRNVLSEFKL